MNMWGKSLPSPHTLINNLIKLVPTMEQTARLNYQHQNLKQQLKSNLIKSQLITEKSTHLAWIYKVSLQKTLLNTMNNLLLISSNGYSSNHPKFFTCITVNQTSVFREHWRWNYPSTSKTVGCHPFCLLPITINKQDLAGLKLYRRSIIWYILIYLTTRHPS